VQGRGQVHGYRVVLTPSACASADLELGGPVFCALVPAFQVTALAGPRILDSLGRAPRFVRIPYRAFWEVGPPLSHRVYQSVLQFSGGGAFDGVGLVRRGLALPTHGGSVRLLC
jgi:hypothetical protein